MKRFEDLSHDEIVSLGWEDVQRYIDIECAIQGVPLLPPEPIEPEAPNINPDMKLYVVGNFKFNSAEDASKAIELLTSLTLFETSYTNCNSIRYVVKKANPDDYYWPKMTTENGYSEANFLKFKKEIEQYDMLKKTYDSAKKEYDSALKDRNELAESITSAYYAAGDIERRKERYMQEFNRYLSLADGNKKTAMNFLINAHQDIAGDAVLSTIIEKLAPGYNEQAS